MAKAQKNRAKAFEMWEDTRVQLHLTREQLAKRADVDLKWLNDFIGTGLFAEQVARIKKVEWVLGINLPAHYYESKKETDLKNKE